MKPPPGTMIWWRFKGKHAYLFGYCTYLNHPSFIRLGRWNGDTKGGVVVDPSEIEWSEYQ